MEFNVQSGYVVYKNPVFENSQRWQNAYESSPGNPPTLLFSDRGSEISSIGNYLVALGQAEMQKELDLINQATGGSYSSSGDIREFIQKFNEIMMGVQQFKNVKDRLNKALEEQKRNKANSENGQKYSPGAPTLSTKYGDILAKILTEKINNIIDINRDSFLNMDFSAFTSQFDAIIDSSIMEAFQQTYTSEEMSGATEADRAIYEASQLMSGFNQSFLSMIKSKINFESIRNLLENETIKVKNKEKTGVSSLIRASRSAGGLNLGSSRKVKSLGGSVQEYIDSVLNSLGAAQQKATSFGTMVLTSEKARTDLVSFYSYSQNISAQEIVKGLDTQLQSSTSLLHATSIINDFWNANLKNMDKDNFIIFGSSKAYDLDSSGFHAGGKRNLNSAAEILTQVGYSSDKAQEFMNAAYNTGAGAIYEGWRGEITEQLKIGLSKAVAQLLFDDWVMIGAPSGAQGIHVLHLDSLQVPLSVFLIAAGKAMLSIKDMPTDFISISVYLPDSIKYTDKNDYRDNVLEKWNKEAASAKAKSGFSLVFLKNFSELIAQWLG